MPSSFQSSAIVARTILLPFFCHHVRFSFGLESVVLPILLGVKDGNMGLVKQVASALTKKKIVQLTHTYITLSLRGEFRFIYWHGYFWIISIQLFHFVYRTLTPQEMHAIDVFRYLQQGGTGKLKRC